MDKTKRVSRKTYKAGFSPLDGSTWVCLGSAHDTYREMRPSQANQGCWTCKGRKIGCDKSLPSCNNCSRTGRKCKGYGVRLTWPDSPDGRRKLPILPAQSQQHHHPRPQLPLGSYYGQQFLNVSSDDVETSRRDARTLALAVCGHLSRPRPKPSLTLLPEFRGKESDLMLYYEDKIARMISTIDANNGFRLQLLPMALNGSSLAASGLRSAILALSAFHRYGPREALPYKIKALGALSQSLDKETAADGQIDTQLAASMMMCVYNVFDEEEGNWHLHLNGSRSLLHKYAAARGGNLAVNFLNTWFLYHEILGAFSQPHKHKYAGTSSLDLLRGDGVDKTVIIGSLGCSIETMEIIHHINQLRAIAALSQVEDPAGRLKRPRVMWTFQGLQDRLFRLKQQPPANYADQPVKERTKIILTADFYHTATVLYLRSICPNVDATNQTAAWLNRAFEILAGLEICTSPWPLFVVACESRTDEQRIVILQTLDQMDTDRKIGNVYVLRNLIENYWKQRDLQADGDRPGVLRWWELLNSDNAAPWFI